MSKKYHLLIVLAALIYASYIIVNRTYLLEGLTPIQFAAGSSLFSAFFSLIFLGASDRREEIKGLNKEGWIYIIVLGVIMGAIYKVLLFVGQSLLTASSTGFLLRVAPLFALIFGYLFMRETLSRKHVMTMLIMIFGVYLLTTGGSFSLELGDVLILSGGVLIGFDHAFSRKIIKKGVTPMVLTGVQIVIGAVLLFLVVELSMGFRWAGWKIYLISGLLIFLAKLSRNMGLKHIKASIGSSILLLSPLFTAAMGFFFLGETLGIVEIAGGLLILVGGYIIVMLKSESKRS